MQKGGKFQIFYKIFHPIWKHFFFIKMIIFTGNIWTIKKLIYFISKRGQKLWYFMYFEGIYYLYYIFHQNFICFFLIDFAANFPQYANRFLPSHMVKEKVIQWWNGPFPKIWTVLFFYQLWYIVLQNSQD